MLEVPSESPSKFEAVFTFEKTTKNCARFTEDAPDGAAKIGTLYVQKDALGKNIPAKIRVSVEVSE
jgi:hypothetical protein